MTRLAGDFRLIGNRFEEYARQASKAQHLLVNLHECAVRAGRLLISAIDADCFPEAQTDVNGGWWDRHLGRLPGGVLAVSGGFSWSKGDPAPNSAPDYLEKATQSFSPDQLRRCWTFAIGSWLARRFPDRFRHNAEKWDWKQIATDQAGQPLGRDGEPLRVRSYKDGKPLSTEEAERLISGVPSAGHYETKTAGEFAYVGDSYDQSDSLAHHRIRAEVYSDGCRLMADLIEGDSPPEDRRAAEIGHAVARLVSMSERSSGPEQESIAPDSPSPEEKELAVEEAIKANGGDKWATRPTIARLAKKSPDAVRSKINRAKSPPFFPKLHKDRIPGAKPNEPKYRYDLNAVWPLLFPAR